MSRTPVTPEQADSAEAVGHADASAGEQAGTSPEVPGSRARIWPQTGGAAPWHVLAAGAIAGLATVLTEPYRVVGIAGLVTGLAVVAVPAAAVVTNRASSRRLLGPLPLLAVAAALALLAAGTFRAAAWLYVLCVLTALWLISYTLSAGRRWPGVLLGGGTAWVGVLRGRVWLADGNRVVMHSAKAALANPGDPDAAEPNGDAGPQEGATAGDATPRRLGLPVVVLLTTTVLVVFGTLLASADDEFSSMLSDLVSAPSPDLGGRIVMGAVVAAFALGTAYVARVPPRLDRIAASRPRVVGSYEWAVPAGSLVLLFGAFTVVQFTTLFGGEDHLILTDGLTYATYARSGFGELVTVTVLTLGVLAAVARWAPRGTPSQRNLVRVLAGAICVLTLVIVASAVYRMDLYQEAYGLTRLRLVVTTFELWLGLVFVLVLVAGIRLRAAWLPRAVVGTAVAALLGMAALNPDAYIAESNVEHFETTGRIDYRYLKGLSADAVPVLSRLPEPERSCSLRSISIDLADDEPLAAFNVSRQRARSILAGNPVDETLSCRGLTDRG